MAMPMPRPVCAKPGGNAHRPEAGATTRAAPFLHDDELHREFDRHAAACHAEHQALARWRHATAVDRLGLLRAAERFRRIKHHGELGAVVTALGTVTAERAA